MPDFPQNQPIDSSGPRERAEAERPELSFDPGEIAPCIASPYPDAELSPDEERALKDLAQKIGNIDVAARRFEVEQSWQSRLAWRGYQYLFPRRGGGWIYIPFATDYQRGRSAQAFFGNETNIYATYGEILVAAITRDIPTVRFEPQDPSSDADLTAKDAATDYARVFSRNNDLLGLHEQLAYFLATDGRALIVTDHIIDAQQFGRSNPANEEPVVPETASQEPAPFIYLIRHGETDENTENVERGRAETDMNDKGERQVDRAAQWLTDKKLKALFCSPITRSLRTCQILSQKLNIPYEADDRLASLDHGMEGQASNTASSEIEEAFEERPDEPITEGHESPEDFENRVQAAIIDYLSAPDKPIGLVVHDSVISEVFEMFQGENVPPSSTTEPGWIVALTPNPDGTFKPCVVYPVTPPDNSVGEQRGRPRGQEIATVYGKLEHKIPFNSGTTAELKDCNWVQVAGEYDVAHVKAMFPEKADRIRPGGAAAGENELDRIARINANLALEASYVTGDSMVRDCTLQRIWMRPAHFMSIDSVDIRCSLFEKFPDGVLIILAGDEFIKARNECMDDHLTLIHASPGSGPNRLALCSKLLSIQKRLNNWMDLIDQYFIKCVPMRYIASGPFDVEAINEQGTTVGGFLPFLLDSIPPNRTVQDLIWMEPFPQAQPIMGEFIKFFVSELPQLISHALPTLFGALANVDTATQAVVQRDQALAVLGTPWHRIQVATASYFRQAVQLAARCRTEPVEAFDAGGVKIHVELADMKGNILAYPESDPNFPETATQKESRWRELLQDASNPLFTNLMTRVKNRIEAVKAVRLEGIKDPGEDAWEKQLGEFAILCKTTPIPNPEYVQAEQALQETQQQIMSGQQQGAVATPEQVQALQQMEQQLQTIPPLLSSIRIRDTDNHAIEAECCLDKINSPDGRKLADGDDEDRAAFDNLTLHYQEHMARIKEPPDLKALPKGLTANLKDMPPDAAANLLTAAGLETKGEDVVQTKEFNAELKKTAKVGGGLIPGVEK